MKRLNLTFLTIASFVTMTMCSCIAYRPQVVEMPLIHEKGELQINGSIGLSAPFGDGYLGTTVSYGATDWLAVQGHANWNGDKGGYGQVSVGAFKAWDKAVLEGYIGYGFGGNKWTPSKDSTGNSNGHVVTSHYHLPFVQVNFGWAGLANGHIDIGVGLKGGCLLPNIEDFRAATESRAESRSFSKDLVALLEPQFFMRAGGKHLKWTFNVGFCQLWGSGDGHVPFSGTNAIYMPFTINTGITYDFNVFEKKGK